MTDFVFVFFNISSKKNLTFTQEWEMETLGLSLAQGSNL